MSVAHRTAGAALGAGLAIALVTTPASAASTPHACSPVVPYGKSICLSVGATTVTATMKVDSGGRGWYGQVEIDGPHGKLVRTPDQGLGAPAGWPVSHAADGHGQYCAIDWRWNVYTSTYFEENHVCVKA